MIRAPEFWNYKHGRAAAPFLRAVLTPLGLLYAKATASRIANTQSYDPGIPVISVGNATMGGTGKTPLTAYLLASFNRFDINAHSLSRGYGGSEKGPLKVSFKHSYKQVGDEPLLLARHGTAWVSVGRDDGARAIKGAGGELIILDDAHQNPQIKKTLSFLVVDGEIGFGNERVFPAGPLREPVKAALSRTDAVILMLPFSGFKPDAELLDKLKPKPVIRAYLSPSNPPPQGKLFAFAGIGRPDKFFAALRRAGAELVDSLAFANHKPYSPEDIKNLLELAKEYDAQLITTEKDYVRLPKGFEKHVTSWPVSVRFEDELGLRRILHPIIEAARP